MVISATEYSIILTITNEKYITTLWWQIYGHVLYVSTCLVSFVTRATYWSKLSFIGQTWPHRTIV